MITYDDGTIRAVINGTSYAWPTYMAAPVSDPLVDSILPLLTNKKVVFRDGVLDIAGKRYFKGSTNKIAKALGASLNPKP